LKKTALILGSAPSPKVKLEYDDIYCANGSVASAYKYCNGGPIATIVGGSAPTIPNLINAIKGMNCGVLYARSMREIRGPVDLLKNLKNDEQGWLSKFAKRASQAGFNYDEIITWKKSKYFKLVCQVCGEESLPILRKKDLSSGMLALVLAVSTDKYSQYIMAGFRFSEEYEYQQSNVRPSGHFDTDMKLLKMALNNNVNIVTTEPSFSQLTGVPLIDG
jgi:hypothetical protein